MRKKRTIKKLGFIFAILIISLASISVSYSLWSEDLQIDVTIETFSATGNCKTIGFWKHQLKVYITGQGSAQVSEEDLIDYCDSIYTLFFDEVFGELDPAVGGDGLSFEEAYAILSSTSPDPADLLRKQLMAAEFNYVSDDYQADDNEMFGDFIEYSEYILVNGISGEYESMKDLLEYFNSLGE